MRLQALVRNDWHAVSALDHGLGLAKCRIDVTLGRLLAGVEIPLQRARRRFLVGALEDVVFVYEMVEFLVLDLDRLESVARVFLRIGADRGDLVPREPQLAANDIL